MIKKLSDDVDNTSQTTVYLKRWLIIFTFASISFLNAFNWIEHNIIQDVTEAFYNKSLPEDPTSRTNAINWFSMVYMICYIPLVFPAMFLLDRYGLRVSVIIGAFLTAIGSIIKCFAVKPELFLVAMLGQTFCAIAQAFTLSVPARLSALWFAPEQVALATSIGVFGNQLGVAAGFLIPPYLVEIGSIEFMEKRFYYLYISIAVLTVISLIMALACKKF
jgi:FLVCR family feline leukemia virus subgroup C receptor-related protein